MPPGSDTREACRSAADCLLACFLPLTMVLLLNLPAHDFALSLANTACAGDIASEEGRRQTMDPGGLVMKAARSTVVQRQRGDRRTFRLIFHASFSLLRSLRRHGLIAAT